LQAEVNDIMNADRAQAIIESTQKINVHLDGIPVWIDNVDRQNHTATVHAENRPNDTRVVPVERLIESE